MVVALAEGDEGVGVEGRDAIEDGSQEDVVEVKIIKLFAFFFFSRDHFVL